jgi:GNAT superfamily N-acetyltransferase
MALIVRESTPADRESLIEHFQSLNRFENEISGDRRIDLLAAMECVDEALTRAHATGGQTWVAETDGIVVGFLVVTIETHSVFVREETRTYARVSDFLVRQAERGSGVGRALIEAAERFASHRGLRRLELTVLARNSAAIAAYQKMGFAPASVQMRKEIAPDLK